MRLEADFCTLELPGGWLQTGPLRFAANAEPEALTAEVEEIWQEGEPLPATEHLQERKEFLRNCFEDFGVLSEGPVEAASPRALGITARYENDDFQPVVHREIVLTEGPIRCSLRLFGPEDATDREVIFESIVRSFQLTTGRSLGSAESLDLFSDPALLTSDPRVAVDSFPFLCHSMAVSNEWSRSVEGRHVMLRGGRNEIRIHRLLAEDREAGKWIVRRIEEIESAGGRLLATGRGTTPQGPVSALWSELGAGTWRTAATQRQLHLRLATEEPLEFQVSGPLRQPSEAESVLGPLIASLRSLDPELWRTLPLEPWIDLELKGPWTSTFPGLYVDSELFIPVLELRQQENAPALETVKDSLHEALRQGSGVLPGSDSETAEMGQFRGLEAWRYRADAQLNIRGIFLQEQSTITTCLLQMREAEAADALFQKILEGLRLPEKK